MTYTLDIIQMQALEASLGEANFFYAMKMGQGKTLVALADFERMVQNREVTRMFVCCPNSFKGGWADEVAKHGLDLDVHLFKSGSRASTVWLNKRYTKPPVLVINYEALRSERAYRAFQAWCERKPTLGVWDESIKLKNHKGMTSKRAVKLASSFAAARCLSGKYTTQGPHDLWAQFRALRLFYGLNFYAFRTQYCKMGGWMGKQVVGVQNEKQLARMIDPYMFQTASTPKAAGFESRFVQRSYTMSQAQQAMYDEMHQDFVLWLSQNEAVTVELAVTKYMKLAQIQAGFIIKEDGKVENLVSDQDNPRLEVLKELLAEEIDGKCCIAYKHKHVYTMLMQALADWQPAYIAGNMNQDEITRQQTRFRDDFSCRVMLLQTVAAKYGFTLLGDQGKDYSRPEDACHTMVFFENTYSLDDRAQLEARIDRRGQTYRCLYVDLVGTDLDRDCIEALVNKETMYQAIFRLVRTVTPKVA